MTVLAAVAALAVGLAGASWSSVEVFDLASTDPNLKGFCGGFTDGAFGYLVPWDLEGIRQGTAVRFDLQSFSHVEVLDLTSVDPNLKGFVRGFADGSFGYLVPYYNGAGEFGKLTRFDLRNFGNVEVLDLAAIDPQLKGFHDGFVHGSFGYLAPMTFGKVARFDLSSFGAVEVLDLTATDPGLKGFHDCFTDGSFGYLVPWQISGAYHGKVTRFSLTTFGDVEFLDLTTVDSNLRGFVGGFADASFGYLVPHRNEGGWHGKVVRFDLQSFKVVEVLDLTKTDPDLRGFHGGFSDGSFGYLVPRSHGKAVRLNLQSFGGIEVLDLTATDAGLRGFYGGFTDSSSGYLVPRDYTKVARFAVATTTTTTSTRTATETTTTEPLAVSCSLGYLVCPLPADWDPTHYTLLGSETVPACQPRLDGNGTAHVNASLSECNVSQTKTLASVLLEATIAPSAGSLVLGAYVLHCSCVVAVVAGTGTGFGVEDPALVRVNGSESFEVSPLGVYADSRYEEELQPNTSLAVDSGRFFFQVSALEPSVHVGVRDCVAAPSTEQEDPYEHIFFRNFCPTGALDYQGISSNERHVARFSTRTFKFALMPQVHVTCTVVRCVQSPCGQCARRLAAEPLDPPFVSTSATIYLPPAADVGIVLSAGPGDTKPLPIENETDGTAAGRALAGVFFGLVSTTIAA